MNRTPAAIIAKNKRMGTMLTIPRSQQLSLTAKMNENPFVSETDEPENYLAESDWERNPSLGYCSLKAIAAEI